MDPNSPPARLLTRKNVYPGRTVHLDLERVRLPTGVTTELEIVHHPGAACIVAFTGSTDIVLVRQYRHAVGAWLTEVPAGKLDAGETPAACAARELAEETGYVAGQLEQIGSLHPSPGFCDEIIHVFRATELIPGRARTEEDEVLESFRLPFAEALSMARDGRITDAKTIVALYLAGGTPI